MTKYLLLPLAGLFGLIIRFRNLAFDRGWFKRWQADIPVISVGNLTTGGTGKTPMTEWLIRHFSTEHPDLKIAYLSRGYGRKTRGYLLVDAKEDTSGEVGDEALMIAAKWPKVAVAVCEKRALGIQKLREAENVDLVILDDAFQHRSVRRDLDIVMIDAQRLPTADHLLPAGRLREPLSALKRADVLIVNKMMDVSRQAEIRTKFSHFGKPVIFAQYQPDGIHAFSGRKGSLGKGMRVALFSGIGNPAHFRAWVEQQGVEVVFEKRFRDHHTYRPKDLQEVLSQKVHCFLTTEKDAARLQGQSWFTLDQRDKLAYIPIQLQLTEGEESLKSLLRSLNIRA
ncbi:MAG: tetraacyldisaccharide 4'-kinase [Bacteroidota bacterium]